MILIIGVLAGLVAGLARSWLRQLPYRVPQVRWAWLVLFAFIPQFVAFVFPPTRDIIPDEWVSIVLVGSQALLLIWVAGNLKIPGVWFLGLGLFLNFLVITLNGGLMPIRPELVERLIPQAAEGFWVVGERLGVGKDIVLTVEQTRLWFLSDWFLLPDWLHYPMAFSIGDVIVSLGAFWLLWAPSAEQPKDVEESDEQENQTK